jgi:hypothetical protein
MTNTVLRDKKNARGKYYCVNKLYILYDVPLFYQSLFQGHFTYCTEPMTGARRTHMRWYYNKAL